MHSGLLFYDFGRIFDIKLIINVYVMVIFLIALFLFVLFGQQIVREVIR